ncbi:MAG: UDP-N-acetyl glucosamine 2-epimerase [Desulfosporosinus sp. BRH_c37]|nr:MAG: UDP-N-acetyl glucosamine 2-epimerase [Desulfosporosinus sp. BRH_c37]
MNKRKILGVTGIRSDYEIMSSVFRAIEKQPNLGLELIVTGAHLSHAYGYTIQDIKMDGFVIAEEVESLLNGNNNSSRVKGLAIQLQGMVQTVTRVDPDFLLVLGDREESLTTSLIGAYMNIPVAHIAGGDRVVGNVDDQIRHAVTKLAHLHFTTNEESKRRILRLGEQPFRVFNVGNPGLDRLIALPELTSLELSERLGFEIKDDEPFILLIQHVISTEVEFAYFQMKQTMEAIGKMGIKTIIVYPNSDAGAQDIIRAIREYKDLPFLYTAKNIPRLEFVNIMRRAGCLIGNSSAGILEAPSLNLPVVNIGNRQQGRLHAENVQFVAHDSDKICSAIKKALFDLNYRDQVLNCSNPYGDGDSSDRIAEILSSIPIDNKLLIKDITY